MKIWLQIISLSALAFVCSGCGKFTTMVSSDGENPIVTICGQKAKLPAKVCFNCAKKQAQIHAKCKRIVGAEVQILNEDNPNYENSSTNSKFLILGAKKGKKLEIQNADKKAKYVIVPAYPKCK